jgi:hypothetical protein
MSRKAQRRDGGSGCSCDMEREYFIWASEYSDSGFLSYPKRGIYFI